MKKLLFFVLAAIVLAACNGGKGPKGALESASLSRETLEMSEGQEVRLTVNPTPEDAEFTVKKWSSDNEMVAAVAENGTVTANSVGTAVISAEIEGNGKTIVAKCNVTVKSILDATVFDRAAIFGLDDKNLYDVTSKTANGEDTTYKAATAQYRLLPSTMYIDGDGYMAGDGGYIFLMETSFLLGMTESGEVNSLICLSDYHMVDNCLREDGRRIPFTFQAAKFDKDVYEEYYTLALLAAGGQGEKPDPEMYKYYRDDDSYFLRGFVSQNGLAYLDAGFAALGNSEGIVDIYFHPENEKWQAPIYYDFDAKVFNNPGNYGLAIGEKQDEETGETIYVYLDENKDNKFDMAELADYRFTGGEPAKEEAPAAVEFVETSFGKIGAVPAKVAYKEIAINRALHVALCVKTNVK